MKILVVDKSEKMRTHLETLLDNEGYEVYQASNGADALKILSEIDHKNDKTKDLRVLIHYDRNDCFKESCQDLNGCPNP